MATMIHHHPPKRLHEDDTNLDQGLLCPGSIKRQRLISPRGADSTTTNVGYVADTYPDAIDLPDDTQQRKRNSLDITVDDSGYTSEDETEELPTEQTHQSHHRGHQRRKCNEDDLDSAADDEEMHRVMIPSDIIKKIPEVILVSHHPHIPSPPPLTTSHHERQRQGPVIEEIPYNPLALVPYSPPPLILFPGLSRGEYGQRDMTNDMLTTTQEEGEEEEEDFQNVQGRGGDARDVDAMEVLPMLTPPDAGFMVGAWTGDVCGDDDGGDAMEE